MGHATLPAPPPSTNEELDQTIADLQAQIDNISLTPGPQGPQGKVGTDGQDGTQGAQGDAGADGAAGAAGTDAPCTPCADVASAAVALACIMLDFNPATDIQELRDTAATVVETMLISANICEEGCDVAAEIDTAIDTKLNP